MEKSMKPINILFFLLLCVLLSGCKNKRVPSFWYSKKCIIFAAALSANGTLTEWLGNGLQNRLRRFESARYLTKKRLSSIQDSLFSFSDVSNLFALNKWRRTFGYVMRNKKWRKKEVGNGNFKLPIMNFNPVGLFLPAQVFVCVTPQVLPFRQQW